MYMYIMNSQPILECTPTIYCENIGMSSLPCNVHVQPILLWTFFVHVHLQYLVKKNEAPQMIKVKCSVG